VTAFLAMAVASALIGSSIGVSGIGGFLIVPAMLLIADASPGEAVLVALIANLAAMLVTGGVAVIRGHVLWITFAWLTAGGAVAALFGAWFVRQISPDVARFVIAGFLAAIGLAVLLRQKSVHTRDRPIRPLHVAGVGALAQLSALLAGIGGPAVTVPSLTAQGNDELMAIGTGLLHGILISSVAIFITLQARVLPSAFDSQIVAFPLIVVLFAFFASNWRVRLASTRAIRRIVGMAALVGSVFTMLSW